MYAPMHPCVVTGRRELTPEWKLKAQEKWREGHDPDAKWRAKHKKKNPDAVPFWKLRQQQQHAKNLEKDKEKEKKKVAPTLQMDHGVVVGEVVPRIPTVQPEPEPEELSETQVGDQAGGAHQPRGARVCCKTPATKQGETEVGLRPLRCPVVLRQLCAVAGAAVAPGRSAMRADSPGEQTRRCRARASGAGCRSVGADTNIDAVGQLLWPGIGWTWDTILLPFY